MDFFEPCTTMSLSFAWFLTICIMFSALFISILFQIVKKKKLLFDLITKNKILILLVFIFNSMFWFTNAYCLSRFNLSKSMEFNHRKKKKSSYFFLDSSFIKSFIK